MKVKSWAWFWCLVHNRSWTKQTTLEVSSSRDFFKGTNKALLLSSMETGVNFTIEIQQVKVKYASGLEGRNVVIGWIPASNGPRSDWVTLTHQVFWNGLVLRFNLFVLHSTSKASWHLGTTGAPFIRNVLQPFLRFFSELIKVSHK